MASEATSVIEPIKRACFDCSEGKVEEVNTGEPNDPYPPYRGGGGTVTRAETAKMVASIGKIANDAKTSKNVMEAGQALMESMDKMASPETAYGVKRLKGFITQIANTAPVMQVIENSFDGTLTWTYNAVGQYILTSADDEFRVPGTHVQIGSHVNTDGDPHAVVVSSDNFLTPQTIVLESSGGDNTLRNSFILIEVYPGVQ